MRVRNPPWRPFSKRGNNRLPLASETRRNFKVLLSEQFRSRKILRISRCLLFNSVFLYLIPEYPLADAEALGGFRLHSLMLMKSLEDGISFDLLE